MNGYKKIPYIHASTIVARYEPSEAVVSLLDQEMSPATFARKLEQESLWHNLIIFLAHALPLMHAIQWGLNVLNLRQNEWSKEEHVLLEHVQNWLQSPNETLRIRVNQLGLRIGIQNGPSWLSQAVFWSGAGSIVDPGLPAVMPAPFLYSNAVAASIMVAAVIPESEDYEAFLKKACAIAMTSN